MSGNSTATRTNPTASVAASAPAKTGAEKAQSWLTVASTAAGVIGAVGTGAVWLIANFYTGTVEVRPDQPVESVTIKVYDTKGKESTFHSKNLQLMPGTYHLEVVMPDGHSKHFDTAVRFGETTPLPMSVSEAGKQTEPEPTKKKRWFQFWKKAEPEQKPAG
ncbi:MAG: hypothetical protein K2W95_21755 [Candidatus Obscuribacterales bacterium]|nr:hypothetical protein [Candidatus Obscuribacterales bacterium]